MINNKKIGNVIIKDSAVDQRENKGEHERWAVGPTVVGQHSDSRDQQRNEELNWGVFFNRVHDNERLRVDIAEQFSQTAQPDDSIAQQQPVLIC